MRSRLAPIACLLGLACATAQPVPLPPDPATLPPLPRSSLAAVLGHRGELDLTDEQVRLLQRLDEHLQEENAAIVAEAKKEPPPEPRKKDEPLQQPDTNQFNQGSGMGMGMGGHARKASAQHTKSVAPTPTPSDKSVQERLDDNDTEAYENAERSVLKKEQTERAREIAGKYREDLYDRREMARKRAAAGIKESTPTATPTAPPTPTSTPTSTLTPTPTPPAPPTPTPTPPATPTATTRSP